MSGQRQPELYWRMLLQLRASAICVRLYRNQLHSRVRAVEAIKAVASSAAIGGWVIWHNHPMDWIWAAIIVAAQVLDALKGVFPFARQHKAASDLTIAMETICIDAEDEWESIFAGKLTEDVITKRRTKVRKLQLDQEKKHFPEGFAPSDKLVRMAEREANTYFSQMYAEESSDDRTITVYRVAIAPGTVGEEHLPQVLGQRSDAPGDSESSTSG